MCVNVCMSGWATENSILLSVLLKLNKIFKQSINQNIGCLSFFKVFLSLSKHHTASLT